MTLPCITGCTLSIFKSEGDKAVEFVEEKYGIQIAPRLTNPEDLLRTQIRYGVTQKVWIEKMKIY